MPIGSASSSPISRRTIIVRLAHGQPRATTSRYRPASAGSDPSRPSAVIRPFRYRVSLTNSPEAPILRRYPTASVFNYPPRPMANDINATRVRLFLSEGHWSAHGRRWLRALIPAGNTGPRSPACHPGTGPVPARARPRVGRDHRVVMLRASERPQHHNAVVSGAGAGPGPHFRGAAPKWQRCRSAQAGAGIAADAE